MDDVARTPRRGFAAEYRGEGFDVRTRVRVDDKGVIGPGMWPTMRSAEGLNTIVIPNSLAVRLVRQVVQHDARRLIADTGSGHIHRFHIAKAKANLRDWWERCDILADRDTDPVDQDARDVHSEPYELVESHDEFNDERNLSFAVPDQGSTDAGGRATLLFRCREHVERGYKVLLGVTPLASRASCRTGNGSLNSRHDLATRTTRWSTKAPWRRTPRFLVLVRLRWWSRLSFDSTQCR